MISKRKNKKIQEWFIASPHLSQRIDDVVLQILQNADNKLWLRNSFTFDWIDYKNKIKHDAPQIIELLKTILSSETEKQAAKNKLTDMVETIYVFEPEHQYSIKAKIEMMDKIFQEQDLSNLPDSIVNEMKHVIASCDCAELDKFIGRL